ncbi:hypothetical protein R1flu_007677 [Riccia fluitans]|uniref:Isopenicillin N synthase-like Fe(2+) 2OG dioxygenase domain-containing protein n=1 Tax=Riccia fluitans TaxID=41844 RepID=A0ABD1YZI8_9MARC
MTSSNANPSAKSIETPNPMEVMGLNPHYDVGFTLIAQDEVPGLQLRGKDGKWFSIRPVPGAFCFNVVDSLEVGSTLTTFLL